MTLVEIMVAMGVLALAMGGIFAALMQSRRLTEGSVVQGSVLTLVQGYVEQIKNMELAQMVGGTDLKGLPVLASSSFTIPTLLDDTHPDPLVAIPVPVGGTAPPAMSSLTPGVTPTGLIDNLKNFDIAKDASALTESATDTSLADMTTQVAWSTAWPGAQNYPTGTVGRTDLKLNMWVWISDLTSASANAQKVFGITVIYTWQYLDGGRAKYNMGSVHAIRSSVPTY